MGPQLLLVLVLVVAVVVCPLARLLSRMTCVPCACSIPCPSFPTAVAAAWEGRSPAVVAVAAALEWQEQ
jgi:hypothetical protein